MQLYNDFDHQHFKVIDINYNPILNIIATESLHNRAITKMASKKWMFGHSDDYVSVFVSCFGAHCHSLSFVIISQP